MSAVVVIRDGQVRADSRDIAAAFEKRHDNVLRTVEQLRKDAPDFVALNFEGNSYIAENGRQARHLLMTRDGFSLLAMGFTGAKALEWKIAFIEAFNSMEAALTRQPANDPADRVSRVVDLEGALGTADDRHAIKTALLTINTYKDLYGPQAGRDMLMKLGFPVPGVDLPAAPEPGVAGPVEGDIHCWATGRKVMASRRDATHVDELFRDYTRWCSDQGKRPMHPQRFKAMAVTIWGHEEHPEMIMAIFGR